MGDAAEQQEVPDVIETEGVEVPVDPTDAANDTEAKPAEVIDMNAYREKQEAEAAAKEAKEAEENLKKLQEEVSVAMDVATQMISTGEEVLKVTEGNSYMSKAFDKSVALFDDVVVQNVIQPIWNVMPDDVKTGMTYVPTTVPDVFSATGNSLAQAGFIEVPGLDASQVVENQQKLLSLVTKYGQYIDPELKVFGYFERMAKYIGQKKDEVIYARIRASLARHRAANDNNTIPAVQPQTDIPEAFQNPAASNDNSQQAAA